MDVNVGLDTSLDLDTHSNHAGSEGVPGPHMTEQKKAWEKVVSYFDRFKSTPFMAGSLFDYTTFMVVTEFSRTPFLNANNGKDHNVFTNSVLLAGKGVQGGRSVGASRVIPRAQSELGEAQHVGSAIDFTNGRVVSRTGQIGNKDIRLIFPEDVARTVAGVFGDPAGFSTVDMSRPVIPGVIKK